MPFAIRSPSRTHRIVPRRRCSADRHGSDGDAYEREMVGLHLNSRVPSTPGMWPNFRPFVTKFKEHAVIHILMNRVEYPMNTQIRPVIFAACVATLVSIGAPAAYAVECSAARPSPANGYWSWRLIDGRKCWYRGQAMISKTLLRWPAAAPAQAKALARPVSTAAEKRADPLDAHARLPDDDTSFESRWRMLTIH